MEVDSIQLETKSITLILAKAIIAYSDVVMAFFATHCLLR